MADNIFPPIEKENLFPDANQWGSGSFNALVNPPSNEYAAWNGNMATLAQLGVKLKGDKTEEQLAETNFNRYKAWEEEVIRQEVDTARKIQLTEELHRMVNPHTVGPNPFSHEDFIDDRFTLETEAVKTMANQGLVDKVEAQVVMNDPDFADRRDEIATKIAILQGVANNFSAKQEALSESPKFWDNVESKLNWIGSFIPLNLAYRQLLGSELGAKGQGADIEGRILNTRETLMNLPLPEFKAAVGAIEQALARDSAFLKDNPILNEQIMKELAYGSEESLKGTNVMAALDVMGTGGLAVDAARGGASVMYRSAQAAKNKVFLQAQVSRAGAQQTAMKTILAAQAGASTPANSPVPIYDAIGALLPSNATTLSSNGIGLSGDLMRDLQATEAMGRAMLEMNDMGVRLTGAEAQQAAAATIERVRNMYKPGWIADIKEVGHDPMTGLNQVDVFFGKPSGKGGFSTAEAARTSMEKRGMTGFTTAELPGVAVVKSAKKTVVKEQFVSHGKVFNNRKDAEHYKGDIGVLKRYKKEAEAGGTETFLGLRPVKELNVERAKLSNKITKAYVDPQERALARDLISDFYNALDEFSDLNDHLSEEDVLKKFLKGVPESDFKDLNDALELEAKWLELDKLEKSLQKLDDDISHTQDYWKSQYEDQLQRRGLTDEEVTKAINQPKTVKRIETKETSSLDNVVQDPSGQWFGVIRHQVAEEGFVAPFQTAEIKMTGLMSKGANPMSWLPKIVAEDQIVSANQHLRLNSYINEEILPAYKALNNADRKKLETVLELGHTQEKWFTPQELDYEYDRAYGRLPTQAEKKAYYTAKIVNDFDWTVRNNAIYTRLARAGYTGVEIPKYNFVGNGKFKQDLPDVANMHVTDITTDVTWSPKQPLTHERLKELLEKKDYQIFVLDKAETLAGAHTTVVIGSRSSFKTGPLRYQQLGYRAGGHRIYEPGMMYAKQPRLFTRPDGSKYMMDPLTLTGHPSNKELANWATNLNNLRKAIHDDKMPDGPELDALFAKTSVRDRSHWDQLVRDEEILPDVPIEIVRDGELPASMLQGNPGAYFNMTSEIPIDDGTKYMINRNKRYTGRRGEHLIGPDDEKLRVLDPYEAIDMSLRNAIKTGAYGDYRIKQVEGWHATFKDLLIPEQAMGSPGGAFFNPHYRDGADRALIEKANALRDNTIRQLNMRTKDEGVASLYKDKLAMWVDDKVPGLNQQTARKILDTDVIGQVRAWTRNLQLGLFNPAQPLVQMQTALVAMTTDPVAAGKVIGQIPLMRFALNASDDVLLKTGKMMEGMGAKEFTQMMQELQRSGFANVGDEAFLFARESTGSTAGSPSWIRRLGGGVVRTGNVFLRESERWNRLTAWGMAWTQAPFKNKTSIEARRWIQNKASALSADMNAAGKSAMHQGVQSLPFQYLQYTINMSQNQFGPAVSAGKIPSRFTKKEQAKMMVGAIALYGAAAIPGGRQLVDWAAQYYADPNTGAINENSYNLARRGLLDAALSGIFDTDTSMATRAGMGPALEMLSEAWTNKSLAQFAIGPAYNTLTGIPRAVYDTLRYVAVSTSPEGLSTDERLLLLKELAKQTATGSTLEKAWVLHLGMLTTKSGINMGDGTSLEGIATVLGIPLAREVDTWGLYKDTKGIEDDIEMAVKSITKNNLRAMVEPDPAKQHFYAQMNAAILGGYNEIQQGKINMEVSKRAPEDFYKNMADRALELNPDSPTAKSQEEKYGRQLDNINKSTNSATLRKAQ